jgi:hypothetical protein
VRSANPTVQGGNLWNGNGYERTYQTQHQDRNPEYFLHGFVLLSRKLKFPNGNPFARRRIIRHESSHCPGTVYIRSRALLFWSGTDPATYSKNPANTGKY